MMGAWNVTILGGYQGIIIKLPKCAGCLIQGYNMDVRALAHLLHEGTQPTSA